jgi:acetyl esterase/lipase
MLPDWNRRLNAVGYEVFEMEYRLPPPLRWLNEIGDVKSVLGGTAVHAAEYHGDHAEALNQALPEAGVLHETYFLPGTAHGFDIDWGGCGTQIARVKVRQFLEE